MLGTLLMNAGSGALALEVDAPESAVVGEDLVVTVTVSNPHAENIEFSDLTFPDRVFEDFTIQSMAPSATEDSPFSWFGCRVYYYEVDLEPGGRRVIEMTLLAKRPGLKVIELEACNWYEDCSNTVRAIQVASGP
jgi:hypothetical protein